MGTQGVGVAAALGKLTAIFAQCVKFRMRPAASKIFFTEFENKLNARRTTSGQGDLNLTYAQIIVRQAHHLTRVITGEEPCYMSFTVK